MRRTIFFYLFLFISGFQFLNAQVSVGLRSSIILNDTKVSSGSLDLNKWIEPTLGYSVGGVVNYNITPNFGLQSELNFKHIGFQISEGTSFNISDIKIPVGITAKTTVNYFEVPILLKYQNDFGRVKAYASAGPGLSYAMNGKVQTYANSFIDFNLNETRIDLSGDEFNRFGINGNVGAGLEWDVDHNTFLSMDVRYSHDFSSQVEVPLIRSGVRNSGMALGLGVGYRL